MPLRTRIFIVIALIILAIGGAFGILSWLNKKAAPKDEQQTTPTPQTTNTTVTPTAQTKPIEIPAGTPTKQMTTLEMEQNGAKQLAKIFVERYNSFSTENNYQNIYDSRSLVTDAFWAKISQPLTKPPSTNFVGVTTVVLSAASVSWSASEAEYLIKARRTTEKDGTTTEQYQDIKVILKKVDTKWLIDSSTVVTTK